MTLTTTSSRNDYAGSGTTGPFAYNYRIFAATDLLVTKTTAAGAASTLSWPADFTVTGVGNRLGGTISLTVALATGETLTIQRVRALTQTTDIRNQGTYYPETIEDSFDNAMMVAQQLQEQLDRSLKISRSLQPVGAGMSLTEMTAGKVVTGTGTGFTMSTLNLSAIALPGAGRTVATLSAYLANNAVYNVKDYGAVGDGVTNDTTAVQAAISAGAGVIFFPAGNYVLGTLTIPSVRKLIGDKATLTLSVGTDHLFTGNGTQAAHKSDIEITGFTFFCTDATIARYAVLMSWVDYLSIHHNRFTNIYIANIANAGETFGSTNVATLQHHLNVSDNAFSATVNGDNNPVIFGRYYRDYVISRNVLTGRAAGMASSAIEMMGGNGQPASDGALANARKSRNGVIAGNSLFTFASGISVVQCQDIAVSHNTLDACGEALDAIGCFDTLFIGNTVNGGSHTLQFSGINRNVVFTKNIVTTDQLAGGIYDTSVGYQSADNVGPVVFVDNDIRCTVGGYCVVSTLQGHLVISGNRFTNFHLILDGTFQQLEVDDNRFLFDAFSAVYPNYLIRLGGWNTPVAGTGSTVCFAQFCRNVIVDRTDGYANVGVIVYDSGQNASVTGNELRIEGNYFKLQNNVAPNIKLAMADPVLKSAVSIKGNVLSGLLPALDTGSITAANYLVIIEGNRRTNNQHWLGGIPASGKYSAGSTILSNDPAATGFLGWVCTASPNTWKTFGAVTP